MKRQRTISLRMSEQAAHTVASMLGWELQMRTPEFGKTVEGKAARSYLTALRAAEKRRRRR